jgi:hypothetical protein
VIARELGGNARIPSIDDHTPNAATIDFARVVNPTSSAICCDDNPEFMRAGVDKAARLFGLRQALSHSDELPAASVEHA